MTVAEKNIVSNYFHIFEKLNPKEKMLQISQLFHLAKGKDLPKDKREELFFSSAGGWQSEKTADEEISEIRAGRYFRNKDLDL